MIVAHRCCPPLPTGASAAHRYPPVRVQILRIYLDDGGSLSVSCARDVTAAELRLNILSKVSEREKKPGMRVVPICLAPLSNVLIDSDLQPTVYLPQPTSSAQ